MSQLIKHQTVLLRNIPFPGKDLLVLIPAYLLFTTLILLALHHPFFWDTIQLSSEHAHWFYSNNFNTILLPNNFDSGHIPFMGLYLAFCWKLFGISMPVSHLAMLPFVLGILTQTWLLIKKIIPERWQFMAFMLFLADPTLLSQLTLVSPDVLLIFFLLASLNAILSGRNILLSIALTGLVLSSMRGMMLAFALFLFSIYHHHKNWKLKELWSCGLRILPFWLPSALIVMTYLGFHYLKKGWIGYHTESPWAASFAMVSLKNGFGNFLILGWRLIDFGRIFLWIAGLYLLIRQYRHQLPLSPVFKSLSVLFALFFLTLVPSMVLHKGLMNHRYLLPLYLIFSLQVFILLMNSYIVRRKIWIIFLLLALLSGNLWRYPEGVSTGWDSTLAHWPWYTVREEIMLSMEQKNIAPEKVGTLFPELAEQEYINPGYGNGKFSELDTSVNQYILWSNVMNGFPKNDLQHIKQYWITIQEWQCFGIKARLYRNPRH
jgi:hypothetical protein